MIFKLREYILKFVNPQITIQEEAKEDFKRLMGWSEREFMSHVFVRLKDTQVAKTAPSTKKQIKQEISKDYDK